MKVFKDGISREISKSRLQEFRDKGYTVEGEAVSDTAENEKKIKELTKENKALAKENEKLTEQIKAFGEQKAADENGGGKS